MGDYKADKVQGVVYGVYVYVLFFGGHVVEGLEKCVLCYLR